MSSSGTRRKEDVPLDADGNAIVDGLLTPTPDSPADSEWRSRAGPLDVNDGGGPWKQEDSSGRWFPCRIRARFFFFLFTRLKLPTSVGEKSWFLPRILKSTIHIFNALTRTFRSVSRL